MDVSKTAGRGPEIEKPQPTQNEPVSFVEATRITPLDTHTYRGYVPAPWCNNGIAMGGFSAGLLTSCIRTHFATTHASLAQPHTLSLSVQYLRPTPHGAVRLHIHDTKLGRKVSVVHISLHASREDGHGKSKGDGEACLVGYAVQGRVARAQQDAQGISLDTGYAGTLPVLPAKGTTAMIRAEQDPNWTRDLWGAGGLFRTLNLFERYVPRAGMTSSSMCDRWVRCRSDVGGWTDGLMGSIGDLPWLATLRERVRDGGLWLATQTLNIELKKPLDERGVEWLLARTTTAAVRDGRLDYNSVVLDEEGDVVALVTQTMMVMTTDRMKGRNTVKL